MSKPRVTVCTAVVARPQHAQTCLASLKRYADFPSQFRVLIHPQHRDLLRWATQQKMDAYAGFLIPIIAAKHWMLAGVETEYALLQDCDWAAVSNYTPLLKAMEAEPDLACVSPVMERPKKRPLLGSLLATSPIFKTVQSPYTSLRGVSATRQKLTAVSAAKREPDRPYYHVDYTTISATMIRMEAYREHPFDTGYGMGLAHEDWFMGLRNTKWKKAVHRGVRARMLGGESPEWYRELRWRYDLVKRSKRLFAHKWGTIKSEWI